MSKRRLPLHHFSRWGLLFLLSAGLSGCVRRDFVNTATLPDTYLCSYMKDICKEAEEFERNYSRMSKEHKKASETILKTYQSQCADAQTACLSSKPTPHH